jgi:hypothetical protein
MSPIKAPECAISPADFAVEIWESCRFFFDYIRGVPYTRSRNVFDQA